MVDGKSAVTNADEEIVPFDDDVLINPFVVSAENLGVVEKTHDPLIV